MRLYTDSPLTSRSICKLQKDFLEISLRKRKVDCSVVCNVLYSVYGVIVLQGGWPLFLHRMGVVRMDKKPFDFKDLMAFGMFVLALLTFVFTFLK